MKTPKKDAVEKLKQMLLGQALVKKESAAFFKKGGTLADFQPKDKIVARPF